MRRHRLRAVTALSQHAIGQVHAAAQNRLEGLAEHTRPLLTRLRNKAACAAPDAFQHRIAVVLCGQHDGLYLALLLPDPVQQIESRGIAPYLIVEEYEIVPA